MTAQIPAPKPPTPVELIDIDSVPDEPCNWRDGNEWESEIHGGYRCDRCDEISECIFCHENQPNIECARNRAREDNRIRRREYERAVQDSYEAQMRYYQAIYELELP